MKLRLAALALLIAGATFVAIGYRNATADPVVIRYQVAVAGLAAPLRIVQLTDMHLSYPDMPPARVRRIVAEVAALNPDMVVMTGDYLGGKLVDTGRTNMNGAMEPYLALHPRLGIYAVRGNHDAAYWAKRIIPLYRIHYLANDWTDAGPVVVAGLDDWWTGRRDVAGTLRSVPAKPVLLLTHNPDAWLQVPGSVALTFAGHTHGGQIKLPLIGAPISVSAYGNRFRRGLIVEGSRHMIVSSGLGTTSVPLRFGVPPEIVEVTLYSVGRKSGTDR